MHLKTQPIKIIIMIITRTLENLVRRVHYNTYIKNELFIKYHDG